MLQSSESALSASCDDAFEFAAWYTTVQRVEANKLSRVVGDNVADILGHVFLSQVQKIYKVILRQAESYNPADYRLVAESRFRGRGKSDGSLALISSPKPRALPS